MDMRQILQMVNDPKLRNNPMINNAVDMVKRGDEQGLKNLATNLCRQNNMTPEQVLARMGMK